MMALRTNFSPPATNFFCLCVSIIDDWEVPSCAAAAWGPRCGCCDGRKQVPSRCKQRHSDAITVEY